MRFGMKAKWKSSWKASKKPSKQRKYRWNAPLHIVHKLMSAHLSKELRQKYGMRSMAVRKGDKVKVMRGQFSGTIGEIDEVDLVHSKVYVKGAEFKGKAGTAPRRYPLNASKLMLISLNTDDKARMKKLRGKGLETAKSAAKK